MSWGFLSVPFCADDILWCVDGPARAGVVPAAVSSGLVCYERIMDAFALIFLRLWLNDEKKV